MLRPDLRRPICAAVGLIFLLALPSAAQGAEKTVDMGVPREAQRAFQQRLSDVNDFFPHTVAIHRNDTVRFVPSGFHTVNLPASGGGKLPIIASTGQKVSGSVDAAGVPFFFNGLDTVGFNRTLLTSAFGKTRSYNGSKRVLSGLPLAERPKAMNVKFTKTGSFRYFCDVHLGMTGTVRVLSSDREVPSTRADNARVRAQVASTLRTARTLQSTTTAPQNIVNVGLQGRGGVNFFDFVPKQLTVPVGTTLTFRNPARSEVHTATTGPGDPEKEPNSYLGQIVASLESPTFDPRAIYPSDPPGVQSITPVFHGNGFWSSGALDLDRSSPQVPPSKAVRFGAPGVYQFWCMIHPFMNGTVTVQ
jgi:plastocyanin